MGWRRWRGATHRAGRRWSPPWPFVEPPATEQPARWQSRARRPLPALRHGQRTDPPWPSAEPSPPEQIAEWRRQTARQHPPNRRALRFDPPWLDAAPPPTWRSRRPSVVRPRRGRFIEPPWLTAEPPEPSDVLAVRLGSRRRLPPPVRRGRYWQPIPATPAAGPSRDLYLELAAPELKWHTGSPSAKWATASPELKWQHGNPQT